MMYMMPYLINSLPELAGLFLDEKAQDFGRFEGVADGGLNGQLHRVDVIDQRHVPTRQLGQRSFEFLCYAIQNDKDYRSYVYA